MVVVQQDGVKVRIITADTEQRSLNSCTVREQATTPPLSIWLELTHLMTPTTRAICYTTNHRQALRKCGLFPLDWCGPAELQQEECPKFYNHPDTHPGSKTVRLCQTLHISFCAVRLEHSWGVTTCGTPPQSCRCICLVICIKCLT